MKRGDLVRHAPRVAYLLVFIGAVSFDLRTDRSFGAAMLATIPLATIALACLVASPWVNHPLRLSLWRSWWLGAFLVLFIALLFSSLGFEQAKTGELIATYALLILAFPASLAIPFVEAAIGTVLPASALLRVVIFWTVAVALAYLEWRGLLTLNAVLRRRSSQAERID